MQTSVHETEMGGKAISSHNCLLATVGLGLSGFHDIAAVSGTLSGVGDNCSLRAIYPPVLHLAMALYSISSLSEPLYTFYSIYPHLHI